MNSQFYILSTLNDVFTAINKLNIDYQLYSYMNIFNRIGVLHINDLVFLNARLNILIAYNDDRNRLSYLVNKNEDLVQVEIDDMRGCVAMLLNNFNIQLDYIIDNQNNYHVIDINNDV